MADLKALLAPAGIEPPFVLVGHSYGSLNVRRYARQHPADVTGLVLVDAAHEDMFRRGRGLGSARDASTRQFRMLATLNAIGVLAPVPGLGDSVNAAMEIEWRRMQDELLSLSSNAAAVVAEASSHDVHVQQPDLVVDAIRTLVDRARKQP